MFSLKFHVTNDENKYGFKPIIELIDEQYQFNDEIQTSLNDSFYKAYFKISFLAQILKINNMIQNGH